MRHLATIQKISKLEPINGADRILKATVLGWELVVKKDEFNVGDLCVYIEIDSQLPNDNPNFDFMKSRKYRVKTIKLKGQISQGLALPLSILPNHNVALKEGQDVTDILKITKYDPELVQENKLKQNSKLSLFDKAFGKHKWYRRFFAKTKRRNFPDFIKKTDETRLQNMPWILEKEKHTNFIETEKIDGQSATYFLKRNDRMTIVDKLLKRNEYIFGVCSRNLCLHNKTNSSYWIIAEQLGIKDVLSQLIGNREYVILQGEIIGEGIQGNKYKIKGYDFYAFNLIFFDGQVDSITARNILSKYDIKFVPILNTNFKLLDTVNDMVEHSKGNSKLSPTLREGVVIRNNEKGISFKVINPNFLLKNNL